MMTALTLEVITNQLAYVHENVDPKATRAYQVFFDLTSDEDFLRIVERVVALPYEDESIDLVELPSNHLHRYEHSMICYGYSAVRRIRDFVRRYCPTAGVVYANWIVEL